MAEEALVARGNLAEEACGAGICDGCGTKMPGGGGGVGGVAPGASRALSGRTDAAHGDEEGPSRTKRRTKARERREGGLKQGQEENQAPCVTVHLHMLVELGALWRCSGLGAC